MPIFSERFLRVPFVYFEHQRRVQFEGCVAEPLQTITAILPGSKWSCLLSRIVLQDALSEVMKVYPPMKLKVLWTNITALKEGRQKRVRTQCGKGPEGDEKGSGGEGPRAVDHIRRKGMADQGDCVMQQSGREVAGVQQKRRCLATSVETLGVD